jgi:hypothetical protein
MADEPRDLVLDHLRAIRSDVGALRDDMREVKGRLNAVEDIVAALVAADTRMQHSLDRLSDRTERIARRLGLIDEPA